jgi:hypothetical protein
MKKYLNESAALNDDDDDGDGEFASSTKATLR